MSELKQVDSTTYRSGNNPFTFITMCDGTKRFFGPYNVVDICFNDHEHDHERIVVHEYPLILREFPNISPGPLHKLFATMEIFGNRVVGLLYNNNFDVITMRIDFDVCPDIQYLNNNMINITVDNGKLYCFPDKKSSPILIYNEHFEQICTLNCNLSGIVFAFDYNEHMYIYRETSKTIDILDKKLKVVFTCGSVHTNDHDFYQGNIFNCVKGFIHLGNGYVGMLCGLRDFIIFNVQSRYVKKSLHFDQDVRSIKNNGFGYFDVYSHTDDLNVERYQFGLDDVLEKL